MQMTGEQRVAAPRDKVWQALNDADVLAQCIPGCQSLEKDGDTRFNAIAEVRIGPIGARFKGSVDLSELAPPSGYRLTGTGNGGIAGNAKGTARVRLSDADDGSTIVTYDVEAEVGGRMAQLGGPIIDATAKSLAAKFFARLGDVVGGTATGQPPTLPLPGPERLAAPPVPTPFSQEPVRLWGWVAAIVAALLAGFTLGARHEHTALLAVLVALVITAAASFEAGRRGGRR